MKRDRWYRSSVGQYMQNLEAFALRQLIEAITSNPEAKPCSVEETAAEA